jgi:hypothetical protein
MKVSCLALLALCSVGFLSSPVLAQAPETAVDHLDYLSSRNTVLAEKYLSYMSAVAHGRRARKMEKRRLELVEEIKQNIGDANKLRPYKGDASLKNAYKKYWDLLVKVFNEDYHKIVNMEEIAEQSYDAMEAYMTAQEQARKVVETAYGELTIEFNDFAKRNNITIEENDSKTGSKLEKTKEVMGYYNKLYLVFFKCYKQESYMLDAYGKKDINGTEQNRLTLIKYATEGLAKLDTIRSFNGDNTLVQACRQSFQFYKQEAEKGMVSQIEYLVKRSEFEKIQKSMETTPANKRTQADIDTYNKAVNDINARVAASNKVLTADNAVREKTLKNHNEAEHKFLDTHIPK